MKDRHDQRVRSSHHGKTSDRQTNCCDVGCKLVFSVLAACKMHVNMDKVVGKAQGSLLLFPLHSLTPIMSRFLQSHVTTCSCKPRAVSRPLPQNNVSLYFSSPCSHLRNVTAGEGKMGWAGFSVAVRIPKGPYHPRWTEGRDLPPWWPALGTCTCLGLQGTTLCLSHWGRTPRGQQFYTLLGLFTTSLAKLSSKGTDLRHPSYQKLDPGTIVSEAPTPLPAIRTDARKEKGLSLQ